ncbi:hypothetical protein AB6H11_07565 [Providencia vermicola]|uniref:hypothetical protein n=1 Tax=Providencia vermicola TaxID=333965 RepID=UPI0034DD0122
MRNSAHRRNTYYGEADFENFWGEELSEVVIRHHVESHAIYNNSRLLTEKVYHDIPDKTILKNVFYFLCEIGIDNSYDYWYVKIKTKSGKVYKTKTNFYCSIRESDHGKVILGVNGESRRLYLDFPSSSNCSTALNEAD